MDGEDNPKMMFEGSQAIGFLQYLSMFFDYFQTPKDIITDDYDEMKTHIESVLKESFEHFVSVTGLKYFLMSINHQPHRPPGPNFGNNEIANLVRSTWEDISVEVKLPPESLYRSR